MRYIISLFAAIIGLVATGSNNVTLVTFASTDETGITDSIATGYYKAYNENIDTINIIFPVGKIKQGVEQFKARTNSIAAQSKEDGYFIMGLSFDGSAAATICASESSPEGLILVSGVCVDGSQFMTRMMTGLSYIYDFPNPREIREQMRKEIELYTSSEPFDTIEPTMPEEFRELVKFQPKKYLGKLTCPVFAAFGGADPLVNWYENSSSLDIILPPSNSTVIKTYLETGCCLLNTENNSNLPWFGDMNPNAPRSFNSYAIADIIEWLKANSK
ncbi:MAG: hypothetical protein K2M05_08585 [Paramuribaculum sp.]|nr:hypothetical protein [Paramuribaculum sp.]MDE6304097.1 hypothetical protein [Paramuribaculum sp.]